MEFNRSDAGGPCAWLSKIAHQPARAPIVGPMRLYVIRTGEQLYKHHTCHKSADMGPEGHASDFAAEGRQPAHKLDEKPVTEHHPGRQGYRGEEESKEYPREDAYVRIEYQVGAHDPADSSRRANHRNRRVGIREDLSHGSCQPAEHI